MVWRERQIQEIEKFCQDNLGAIFNNMLELQEQARELENQKNALERLSKVLSSGNQKIIEPANTIVRLQEHMVLAALEDILDNEKYRVWSQVSCSAIFNDSCKSAWHDYNRLYVDFLITEKTEVKINEQQNGKRAIYHYKPKCIVEYNGAGHNPNDNSQLNRQCNDNIKKALALSSGMHFIELEPKDELGKLGKNDWTYEHYCKLYDQVCEQLKNILGNNGYRLQS